MKRFIPLGIGAALLIAVLAFVLTAPKKDEPVPERIDTLNGAVVPTPPIKPKRDLPVDGVCRRADRKC